MSTAEDFYHLSIRRETPFGSIRTTKGLAHRAKSKGRPKKNELRHGIAGAEQREVPLILRPLEIVSLMEQAGKPAV
jgi:hypothetical protein